MCLPLKPVFSRDRRGLPNFIDEPFTGLDMDSQRDLVELLENYRDENNALIIIASHQGVDLDIFDKKIVLSPGGGYKVF